MPTYTYRCSDCGHTFNVFHGMSETGDRECTECGAAAKRQMGTGAGLIFKGSGFYETDYKRTAHSTSSTNGTGSEAGSNGDTATSSGESTKTSKSASSSANKDKAKVA